ncbi:MAG TPA: hypothetical protein VLT47_11120 [Anaeromyxobacteraceae bacterium]|nr:hypothetical protein [Anaeromyxobacteraceae bacterium]
MRHHRLRAAVLPEQRIRRPLADAGQIAEGEQVRHPLGGDSDVLPDLRGAPRDERPGAVL